MEFCCNGGVQIFFYVFKYFSAQVRSGSMEYSYLQQPGFDSSCGLSSGMPATESPASQSFYR